MPDLPEPLLAYLANREVARANAAAEVFGALTDRERALVRDAAVMGFVQGFMRTREEGVPKDPWIVQLVVGECLANSDRYPALGALDNAEQPDQPDRCPKCLCEDCGGLLSQHTADGCGCEDCTLSPQYACSLAGFKPPARINHLAQQLGPLLSTHLGERQQRRCLAVAHAAHHAMHDYDYPNGDPR